MKTSTIINKFYLLARTSLAELPYVTRLSDISFVTTLPAPIILFLPTFLPSVNIKPSSIKVFSLIVTTPDKTTPDAI